MKVLWLAPYPHPLDTQAHPVPWVGTLASLLSQQPEIELTVLNWTRHSTEAVEEFDRDGIHFIYLKVPSVRVDILTLYQHRIRLVRAYLRQHYRQYDILHLHGSELQLPAMTAGLTAVPRLLSVQGIVTAYTRFVPVRLKWLKFLWTLTGYYERRYLHDIQHFICRTSWDKARIRRLSPGCSVYHNWETIRPEFFAVPVAPMSANPDPLQLVFAGGNQFLKGFEEVLQAFNLIRRQLPARLVIAGRATAEDIDAVVEKFDLQHISPGDITCVSFLSAAELAELFRQSFCLVHPSHVDNSPNSVCEAQVAGLPVVAAEVGGVGALITEGETGLLTTLAPPDIARQVLRLHHNPALRHRITQQARQMARRRHNPDVIVQRTMSIYSAVCAAHAGAPYSLRHAAKQLS